jgi:hypothetical protein
MLLDRKLPELTGEAIVCACGLTHSQVAKAAERRLTNAGTDIAALPGRL